MQVLYDLIQSLTKEEKRLYFQHGKGGRLHKIYEGYQKAKGFNKALDQELYKLHFSDVSRAFYSMQKRALLDDILIVLQDFSNNANPAYEFTRQYARGATLLNRRMGDGALIYLKEATTIARKQNDLENLMQSLQASKQALMYAKDASLEQFMELENLENDMLARTGKHRELAGLYQGLYMLKRNTEGTDEETLTQKAQEYQDRLEEMELTDESPLELQVDAFAAGYIAAELLGTQAAYHTRLLHFFNKVVPDHKDTTLELRLRTLEMVMRSGLRAGDFLNLSGIIYKTEKELPDILSAGHFDFLASYYESCALFHFYENDIPLALTEIQQVLDSPGLEEDDVRRCAYYRLAMLIAAHLPNKAQAEIDKVKKYVAGAQEDPLMALIEVLVAIESYQDETDLLLTLDRYKKEFRQKKVEKKYLENLQLMEAYVDKKATKFKYVRIFPPEWHELLRVDYFLQAKAHNQFYYNLLTQTWQDRKQVF